MAKLYYSYTFMTAGYANCKIEGFLWIRMHELFILLAINNGRSLK